MSRQIRSRTRLDPETRREQILRAAAAVFDGRDPAEVTFEEIAAAAGVSRALVYNYFGDRGGLLAALYLRSVERLDAELDDALDGTASPEEQLRLIVERFLELASKDAAAWRLMGSAEASLHPLVEQARATRYERLARAWGATPEARVLARSILGFLETASMAWVDEDPDAPDLGPTIELLHRALWSGIGSVEALAGPVPRGADRPVQPM